MNKKESFMSIVINILREVLLLNIIIFSIRFNGFHLNDLIISLTISFIIYIPAILLLVAKVNGLMNTYFTALENIKRNSIDENIK